MPSFEKSPPELVARFDAVAERLPEAQRRKMFGYPGAVRRRQPRHRAVRRFVDDPARRRPTWPSSWPSPARRPFSPMAGRTMKGYGTLPPDVVADDAALDGWLARAIDVRQDAARQVRAVAPSPRPGMGALPYDGGTTFRVWAPHAEAVVVTGSFDDWAPEATRARPRRGRHERHVVGRRRGRQARRRVPLPAPDRGRRRGRGGSTRTPGRSRARSATRSCTTRRRSTGATTAFEMPAWDELVIYELHVGTFNARPRSAGRLRPGRAAPAVPARPGRQRRPDHAALRVRRRRVVGLQPGPPLRHRIGLRRARRLQALHQGGPRARHRGHRRRRLQPPRARPTSTCGSSTAGARTAAAGSTSTTTNGRSRRGARPDPTTAAARSARSCATTR